MAIVHWIILALWFVFLAYWAIAAIDVKRNIVGTRWWKQSSLRLSILVLVVVASDCRRLAAVDLDDLRILIEPEAC